jgi:hypothetical protein
VAAFVQRGDHRRAVDAEQFFAFFERRFACGRRELLEGPAGVAHEQHPFDGAARFRRRDGTPEDAIARGCHLPGEGTRSAEPAAFRLIELEAGEGMTCVVEQRGRCAPPRFPGVADERGGTVLDPEPPRLIGRLSGRGTEHRDAGGRDRGVGLRDRFARRFGRA